MSTLGTVRLVLTATDGQGRTIAIEREHFFHDVSAMDGAIRYMLGSGVSALGQMYDDIRAGK